MSEMVERVARAMAEATNGGDFTDGRWYTDKHREVWHARARAGIAAMREPTEAMYWAKWTSRNEARVNGTVWRAMIDTALGKPVE